MSYQRVSRNGPWERLAWTQMTLGRVNKKNKTPRRFGSISVQRTPISGFLDFWILAVNYNRSRCAILRRNNAAQAQEFIKNINDLLCTKPSSKSQALLQGYVHEGTFVNHTKMLGNAISFEKNVGPFHKNCVDMGFCPSGRAGELSLR